MQNSNEMVTKIVRRAAALAALAVVAGPLANRSAIAAQQGDAVTISWSGATFMKNFTTSAGITLLTPGKLPGQENSITLNAGPGGAPVTFSAPHGGTTSVQLAAKDLTLATPYTVGGPNNAATANYYAIRFEWHEQGSVEGISEMINDQIGSLGTVVPIARNGSAGNPTWVNQNTFGTGGLRVISLPPTYGTQSAGGHNLSTSDYNTNFGGNYNDAVAAQVGRNTQGGQNRVQLAVSDVNALQGFTKPGGTPSWNRTPGTPGYGKGNPNLPIGASGIQGLGNSGVRHEFNADTVINMPTSQVDPTTGSNYAAGPWNDAGLGNLDNNIVAVGGMGYVANPGTGLERINRTDNQWLHATGRLQNGADFNVATRDAYSGTINAATNNIGLDTSWATGENDNGDTSATNPNALAETRIGPSIKFSGKTSGGSGVRPTIQNGRMSFGHLSSSEAIPDGKNSVSRPMRVLMYRDDADDIANGSNNLLAPELRNNQSFADPIDTTDATLDIVNGFTKLTAKSIVEGSYHSVTNQTYVTVKAPNATFAGDSASQWAARRDTETGIKGDNSGNDVADMRNNIFQSVANFPASSVGNPADQLLSLAFMLPQLAKNTQDINGLNRAVVNPNYDSTLSGIFLGSAAAAKFNADSPETVTTGSSSKYGNSNIGTGSATPTGGAININNGNWLFGDFDQRTTNQAAGISGKGYRDYSDLAVAQLAQAALEASGLGNDWDAVAASNNTAVVGLPVALNTGAAQWSNTGAGTAPTKGDLIVLGDYNSDGKFDGKDLYKLARGTSLATSTGTTTLGGNGEVFADAVRRGVLRKNAALDQLDASATATQKLQASANLANDPSGANAFKKVDVNRDGLIDLKDAKLVDYYAGTKFTSLDDQLSAVQGADGDSPLYTASTVALPISLVDVELTDSSDGKIDTFDFAPIRQALGSALINGDTDFNGIVNFDDYARIDNGFNTQDSGGAIRWSTGDFDSSGVIGFDDYALIDAAFNGQLGRGSLARAVSYLDGSDRSQAGMDTPGLQLVEEHLSEFGAAYAQSFLAAVPEPTSLGVVAAAAITASLRRRRRQV